MLDVQKGSLVRSKKGRDQDKIYMVLGIQGDRVFLGDGKIRTIKRPKTKNVKHVKVLSEVTFKDSLDLLTDEKIAHTISTFEQKDS